MEEIEITNQEVDGTDASQIVESELDSGENGTNNNNRLSVREMSALFTNGRMRTGSVDEFEDGLSRVSSARYDSSALDGREAGVKEISARFKGTSKVETKAQYEQRRQVYQKILLSANYAKTGFKKMASPLKQKMMRRWTAVVRSENLGIAIDPESAKEFLAQHGVTSENVDERDWTEWLEAIDIATNNPSSEMSSSFYSKTESGATNLDLDLEIVQMEEDQQLDSEGESRTHSPFAVTTKDEGEHTVHVVKEEQNQARNEATVNPMSSNSAVPVHQSNNSSKAVSTETTHNPLAPPLTPMHPGASTSDSSTNQQNTSSPTKEGNSQLSSAAIQSNKNKTASTESPPKVEQTSKPTTASDSRPSQAPLQTTKSADTEESSGGGGIFSCCFGGKKRN